RPARLAETADEHVVGGVEVEDLDVVSGAPDLLEHGGIGVEEGALADVDAERDPRDLLLGVLAELDELRGEDDGKIVDAVEPEVLEDADRRALARAREPGDDHDVQARVPHERRPPARPAARVRSPPAPPSMAASPAGGAPGRTAVAFRRRAISSSSRAANSRAVWRP